MQSKGTLSQHSPTLHNTFMHNQRSNRQKNFAQTIQIKALVCDSECPDDIILGWTSMAQLSAWQDYASHKLYIQQISVPLTVRNNVRVLPGKTEVIALTL